MYVYVLTGAVAAAAAAALGCWLRKNRGDTKKPPRRVTFAETAEVAYYDPRSMDPPHTKEEVPVKEGGEVEVTLRERPARGP